MISDFHFLRPWWLVALIPVVLLSWAIWRRQDAAQVWQGIVAPHLLPHLLSDKAEQNRFTPLHLVAIGWIVTAVAMAGPTWKREPAPFADDTAALAIVIKVTPSMKTEDIQPDRLARSVQKIHDLLIERGNAKTALIAYAGSAHIVMPATTDGGIIDTFAQALDPKVMPLDGDVAAEALKLAETALADAGSGSILWITDSIASEQAQKLRQRQGSGASVRLLAPLLPGSELDALSKAARAADVQLVRLTADHGDVNELARAAKFSTATTRAPTGRWQEAGYFLTPIILLVLLPFFRRGWMAQTAAHT
jgi:Ca-activated chloride channel homolog